LGRPVKPGDETAFDDDAQNKSAALSVCRLPKRLPPGADSNQPKRGHAMSSSTVQSHASSTLKPAAELARAGNVRFPNESAEYRRAREALLAEEIELRRHIERVAEQRRNLPPGGEVKKDYAFVGETGPTSFADLFGDKNTLVVYNYMFGPQRERPCPMCTSLLSAWDGEVPDIQQRVALAVVARSPIERLLAFKRERGWHHLPLFSDTSGEFSRDYHALTKAGGDDPAFNVFTRLQEANGLKIRHFWGGEMNGASADPGQDPRGAPDLMPLWTILDVTPEGRGTDWYPKLNYS
jgi:predicted dithiol-disulfide oxidoreductase (DUF899 family)